MELMVNFSLRGEPTLRAFIVKDIIIREMMVKDAEDVAKEIAEMLPEILDEVFEEILK